MRWMFLTVAWAPDAALQRLPTVRDYWKNREERRRVETDAWGARRLRGQREWYEAERAWDEHVAADLEVETITDGLAGVDDLTILSYLRWCGLAIVEHTRRGEKRIAAWFTALQTALMDEHARRCEGLAPVNDPVELLRDAAATLADDDLDAVGVGCMYDMGALFPLYGESIAGLVLVMNEPIRREWRRRPFRWDVLHDVLSRGISSEALQ